MAPCSSTQRVAVVTGAAGGIGQATASRLATEGYSVVVNDIRHDALVAVARDMEKAGTPVHPVVADVRTDCGARSLVNTALQVAGRLDALVNVVGGVRGPFLRSLVDTTEDEFVGTMRLNLSTTFFCMQAALRPMISAQHGRIVNVASTAWTGDARCAHYAAAKAAVVALTRSVAVQVGRFNININAVAPGATDTVAGHELAVPGLLDPANVPLGRLNAVEDVAASVAFLCSEDARNLTGQTITIAGGADLGVAPPSR